MLQNSCKRANEAVPEGEAESRCKMEWAAQVDR